MIGLEFITSTLGERCGKIIAPVYLGSHRVTLRQQHHIPQPTTIFEPVHYSICDTSSSRGFTSFSSANMAVNIHPQTFLEFARGLAQAVSGSVKFKTSQDSDEASVFSQLMQQPAANPNDQQIMLGALS